jgi:hypothetical protein
LLSRLLLVQGRRRRLLLLVQGRRRLLLLLVQGRRRLLLLLVQGRRRRLLLLLLVVVQGRRRLLMLLLVVGRRLLLLLLLLLVVVGRRSLRLRIGCTWRPQPPSPTAPRPVCCPRHLPGVPCPQLLHLWVMHGHMRLVCCHQGLVQVPGVAANGCKQGVHKFCLLGRQ